MRRTRDLGRGLEMAEFTYVPADSESQSIVDVAGTELGNGTWQWQPGSHFTETLHHGKDGNAGERVAQQDGQRAGGGERTSNTQEKTSTNGTTEGDELNMSRLEATRTVLLVPKLLFA